MLLQLSAGALQLTSMGPAQVQQQILCMPVCKHACNVTN